MVLPHAALVLKCGGKTLILHRTGRTKLFHHQRFMVIAISVVPFVEKHFYGDADTFGIVAPTRHYLTP
jgi:hypothetical protein